METKQMTQQERADLNEIACKLVLQINEITPVQWDKHDDKDRAIVLAALQATRRAALLEAAEVAITYGERARDEDLSGSYTSELIVQALDRLAQEG